MYAHKKTNALDVKALGDTYVSIEHGVFAVGGFPRTKLLSTIQYQRQS